MNTPQFKVELTGIPETLLWPLYCRAEESRRPDSFLDDPVAEQLYASIDYPFRQRFGDPRAVLALRALTFDRQIEEFLSSHPAGTVVALGDGLETQFQRVDNQQVRWVSVDLADVIALRRRVMPPSDRTHLLSRSALDHSWMDEIDASDGLLITALGLFMYLDGDAVFDLVAKCAERFPRASMMFDAVPPWLVGETTDGTWLSKLMMRGRDVDTKDDAYRLPPMVWGATFGSIRAELSTIRGVAAVRDIKMVQGRGLVFKRLNPLFGSLAGVRDLRPCNILIEFA
ncbi:class I SAM-dependent methyltransferase [Rhodococcoides yunnanense]|uniref:class I SAM-dependent methyltransferase n=1 Tax=Rhodococcoides yunnanense TaxID=278209 RepID=UPI000934692F|nr:class I SAM-dependent methyltransferase [Rhodococcus yunnanensis]